jgi:hypothetical protein
MRVATFIARVESNAVLINAIASLYHAEIVRRSAASAALARDWRAQTAQLIEWRGRAILVDDLMDLVPGLSVRDAVVVTDLAGRAPSESMRAQTAN